MGTCKVLACYFDPPFLPDDSDILTSYQSISQSQYDKLDKKESNFIFVLKIYLSVCFNYLKFPKTKK